MIILDAEVDPNEKTHFVAATVAGVYEKKGSAAWNLISDFEYTKAVTVSFDPTDADGSSFYVGTQERLAKTVDNGANWTYSNQLANHWVNDIAVLENGNTLYISTNAVGTGSSGIFKSGNPAQRAKAIVEATTHYKNAEILAQVSENLGEPMVGINVSSLPESEQLAVRGW